MKVLIIGSGRMGVRHAQGIIQVPKVSYILMADITEAALDNSRSILGEKVEYCLTSSILNRQQSSFDVCIIAATAVDRIGLLKIAELANCKYILIEKPLGQSMKQVLELKEYIEQHQLNCVVNLNMRLYESFIRLKNDLLNIPQLQGNKTITVNTGTLGIGANGIHYLDLLYFILNADNAKLIAGQIDDAVIPSGRGTQFADFGGWAVINFYREDQYVGKAFISMASDSTVFGSWEIVAPHGRIYFNEVEGKRVDTLRKEDSLMPVNRYYADYQSALEMPITSPFLGDLTAAWIKGLVNGENLLPDITASVRVHQLMFDWLGKSKTYKDIFPIT